MTSSQTAKALRVKAAFHTLASEYAEVDARAALLMDAIACSPFDDLSKLHDLIIKHETLRDAAAELAA